MTEELTREPLQLDLDGLTDAEWEHAARSLDARLTETIAALIEAASVSEPTPAMWERWRGLTNHRLPDWRDRKPRIDEIAGLNGGPRG